MRDRKDSAENMHLPARRSRLANISRTHRGRRRWLLLLMALWAPALPTAWADDPDNCLFCHQYRGLGRYVAEDDTLHLYYTNPDYHRRTLGAHARIQCTGCHERSEVSVVPHKPVSRVDCTITCHLSDASGLRRQFSHSNIEEMLERSVHTLDVLSQMEFSRGLLLAKGQSLCLYCHDEPIFRDPSGAIPVVRELGGHMFDRCDVCHVGQIPADVAYYVRHIAARLQTARPTLEMAQVCAVCHSDPQVLDTHDMHNAVASFVRSFHGKAALLGDETTPDCVSCHVASGANAHLMLGSDNPASAVHPQRVADSCRSLACHPGADKALAAAGVHLDLPSVRGTVEYVLAAAFIILTIATFGPSMIIVVLELFGLIIGRAHHSKRMERLTSAVWAHPAGRERLTRFTVSQRVQHWILAVLFAVLALTGFPMKFADQAWARSLIDGLGGLSQARQIHHWAGIALIAGFVIHITYIAWTLARRMRVLGPGGSRPGFIRAVTSLPMWIGPRDVLKMGQLLAYLMFLRKEPPTFGRFSIKEKFEYIGVFWGTTLLGVTGALLWGEQIATRFMSGRGLNIALIAHTYEAFLAVIHVGILHIINVMLSPAVFPLSLATLSGRTPIGALAEEHSEQVLEVAHDLGISSEEV